jgi:hypothetical protein
MLVDNLPYHLIVLHGSGAPRLKLGPVRGGSRPGMEQSRVACGGPGRASSPADRPPAAGRRRRSCLPTGLVGPPAELRRPSYGRTIYSREPI